MSSVERGIIIAGGNGLRAREMSGGRNKHTIDVAGRPMIEYPLQTLRDMEIEKVTIVSSEAGVPQLEAIIDAPDLDIEYKIQPHAMGMADAVGHAAVKEDVFVVLCGDTYHDPTPKIDGNVQLWWTRQEAGNHGAVWVPEINRIVEKPPKELARLAIIGIRVYNQSFYDRLHGLTPSSRNEYELVDVDNWYLANDLEMTHYGGFFGDMGTLDGMKRVEDYIRAD